MSVIPLCSLTYLDNNPWWVAVPTASDTLQPPTGAPSQQTQLIRNSWPPEMWCDCYRCLSSRIVQDVLSRSNDVIIIIVIPYILNSRRIDARPVYCAFQRALFNPSSQTSNSQQFPWYQAPSCRQIRLITCHLDPVLLLALQYFH